MLARLPKGFAFLVCLAVLVAPKGLVFTPVRTVWASQVIQAAPASQARLYPLEKQNFPDITTYLDVFDESGNFFHDLAIPEVRINENGQQLPLTGLNELRPGVQFALALSFGPSMGIRDSTGRSRYDYLLENIQAWEWFQDDAVPDDLSLV